MKALVVSVLCILLQATAAGDLVLDATVSGGDAVVEAVAESEIIADNEVNDSVIIPDITGMTEEDAIITLGAIVLPDGTALEIIKNYAYSSEIAEDIVYEQSIAGKVAAADAGQVHISISLGQEPDEILAVATQEVSPLSTFGLARYMEPEVTSASSQFGIDWDSLPASYEYNWDNSSNCWYQGVWIDGECFKSPEGKFNTDVRHKIQLYCDGQYVYLRIVYAREYKDLVNGSYFQFFVDDEMSVFQIMDQSGNAIGKTEHFEPGVHEMQVQHAGSHLSGKTVPDAKAYLTRHEKNFNPELELRIPLSEMQRQNDRINLEHIGKIEFFTPNLMHRRITASGASTYPMASAAAALLFVPGSTALLKRFGKKKKKDHNE